jgi:prolyl-tRNA editing enzyme YbaK/EbsC (Cys-tRNA(Pro) deacylase)
VSKAIDRFLESARVLGHPVEVRRFPEGTKTAADAASSLRRRCIVKSLVFYADGRPVLVLTSGANRVDVGRLSALLGAAEVRRANADEVREATGFAVGGTPPFGHPQPVRTLFDRDLLGHLEVVGRRDPRRRLPSHSGGAPAHGEGRDRRREGNLTMGVGISAADG